jgi:hypothetical protein
MDFQLSYIFSFLLDAQAPTRELENQLLRIPLHIPYLYYICVTLHSSFKDIK